jgi:hypothetical protein
MKNWKRGIKVMKTSKGKNCLLLYIYTLISIKVVAAESNKPRPHANNVLTVAANHYKTTKIIASK